MTVPVNEMSLLDAVNYYESIGMCPHPLSRPEDQGKSPGKRPLLEGWEDGHKLSDREKEKYFKNNKCNIGNSCGQVSGVTVIDRDFICKGIWDHVFTDVDISGFVMQSRTIWRDHVWFLYSPTINSMKHHALGFEVLNNGSNVVITPSVHVSGAKYQFNKDPVERPHLPDGMIAKIKEVTKTWASLESKINKCRPTFQKFFKTYFTDNTKSNPLFRDMSIFHGATGRELTLHLFAELKRNGATKEELMLLSMLIFMDDYNAGTSSYQIDKINPEATATMETIKKHQVLSAFCNEEEFDYGNPSLDEEINNEVPEYILEKAKDILQHGNPVEFIISAHQKMHVGDVNLAKTLLVSIGVQSVINSEGLQPKVSGDSGKGKTHCCKSMAHLIPRKWMHETSLSNKAIYYMGEELLSGSIIFCDDAILSEEMQGVIKRATSSFQTGDAYTTIDANRKKKTLRIPGRIVWWITSVDDDQGIQLLNRQFGGGVDEGAEQDEAVAEHQLRMAACGEVGFPENDEVFVCREIIRLIKEHVFTVKIPYAKNIHWHDKSNRRNLPIFLDVIKGFTVLRYMQRNTDIEGELIASIEDYNDAKSLYTSRAENQGLKLTDVEKKLCRAISSLGGEVTLEQAAEAIGVSIGRVRHLVYGKNKNEESGLLHKVKGFYTERRNVETRNGARVNKIYLILKGFNVLEVFQNVVELDYDSMTPTNTHSNTPFHTHIITNSRECDTSHTPTESTEISANNSRSQSEPSLCMHNSKMGIKGTTNSVDIDSAGMTRHTREGNNGSIPSHAAFFEGNSTFVESVHKFCDEWTRNSHKPIDGENCMSVAKEYCQIHDADQERVLLFVQKYAKVAPSTLSTYDTSEAAFS
jgi:hypothetical protein